MKFKSEWVGILLAGVFVLITVFVVSCTKTGASVAAITPREAMGEARNDFAVIVDVREEDEVKGGMAENAVWIPTSKIKANDPQWTSFLEKTSKDKKLVFYCAAGVRAGKIAAMAAEHGFRAANMGGYKDWVAAGLPTKK
jgi:rhodanese-related sulfurtransferase